jgi:GNAT superfamily N-acetyltransferase
VGRDGYEISTDPDRLDVRVIWEFLRTSYWSPGVTLERVRRQIDGSVPLGLYAPDGSQAGFARIVGDGVSFAWIADVFVLPEHRGKGLGAWLMETVLAHPFLAEARQILLATEDAHGLYERFGFEVAETGRYLVLRPSASSTE